MFLISLGLCAAAPAAAQLSGSLSIANDQRFRGYSLSGEQPVATLSLFYDHPSGAYGAVSGTALATEHSGLEFMSLQESIGFARRITSGATVDIGVTRADYTRHSIFTRPVHYTEAYLGVIGKNLSARIYLSPHYFRSGVSTLYGEVDGHVQPARGWRLIGHVGMVKQIGGPRPPSSRGRSFDWRLGVGRQLGSFDLHVNWVGRFPGPRDRRPELYHRRRLVVGLTYTF